MPLAALQNGEAFTCDGAGQRVAHKRRPVHKAARVAVADGVGDLAGRERGGERHGATGQRFAEAQNIRGDTRMFTRKQLTGAAKAGGDFVGDQQNALAVAHLTNAFQPLRMVHAHPACTLHNRLQNDGGNFVAVRRQQARKTDHIHFVPLTVEAALRRGGKQVFR